MKIGKVEAGCGFLILAAWLNYVDRQGLFLIGLMSCVLHECGHLAVLHILRKPIRKIRLTVSGAEICMVHGLSYGEELAAAAMGPAVNIFLAGLLCHVPGMEAAAGMNLILGCFNLLPMESLDGGRILHSVLSILFGAEGGDRIAFLISHAVLFVVCVVGLILFRVAGNLTLMLTSAWLLQRILRNGRKRGRKSVK